MDFALRILSIALTALALLRLVQKGLWAKEPFRAFGCMLAVGLARDLALLLIPYHSHGYAVAWELSLPPLLLSHAWAALAAFWALTDLYPSAGRFPTGLLATCLAIVIILCCAATPFETTRMAHAEVTLRAMFLVHRWTDSLCAGAVILAAGFLSPHVRRLPANVLKHICLLGAYFSAYSLTWLAENLAPLGEAVWIERGYLAAVSLLYVGWIFSLSLDGRKTVAWPKIGHVTAIAVSLLRPEAR